MEKRVFPLVRFWLYEPVERKSARRGTDSTESAYPSHKKFGKVEVATCEVWRNSWDMEIQEKGGEFDKLGDLAYNRKRLC